MTKSSKRREELCNRLLRYSLLRSMKSRVLALVGARDALPLTVIEILHRHGAELSGGVARVLTALEARLSMLVL